MAFSSYLDNKLIDHTFGAGTFTKPALYLALGVAGAEISTSGTGYARQPCSFDITTNTASLHANVDFPLAQTSWGTVDTVFVYDAVTGGNLLATGTLTPTKTVNSGDIFRAPASGVTLSVT